VLVQHLAPDHKSILTDGTAAAAYGQA